MGKSFIRTLVNAARDTLFLWRTPCSNCRHRLPDFVDGLCFECRMKKIEREFWSALHSNQGVLGELKKLGVDL